MKVHPIIFSGPMVRALLDGRKTQTRRLAWRLGRVSSHELERAKQAEKLGVLRPSVPSLWQRVESGDQLWVRERAALRTCQEGEQIIYHCELPLALNGDGQPLTWRPSRHMPRRWSRLTLIAIATKIERLHEIGEDDALAEGIENHAIGGYWPSGKGRLYGASARTSFRNLWNDLHRGSWDENPEVVVLTFTTNKQNIDAMEKTA